MWGTTACTMRRTEKVLVSNIDLKTSIGVSSKAAVDYNHVSISRSGFLTTALPTIITEASVVHEDIDPPFLLDDSLHGNAYRLVIAHIKSKFLDPGTESIYLGQVPSCCINLAATPMKLLTAE
jgi:hypothetical protein